MVCVEMEALAMLGHMGHNKGTSGSQCPPQLMCSKTLPDTFAAAGRHGIVLLWSFNHEGK